MRRTFFLPLLPTLAPLALAGTDYASITKIKIHEQVGPTQVQPLAGESHAFDVSVDGPGTMTPPPTISGPISIGEPFHNGGALGHDPGDNSWGYGFPSFSGWYGTDQAVMDGFFGSGVYDLTVSGVTIPVDLSGDLYPPAPILSFSGGSWVGDRYVVPQDQPLTITASPYPGFGSHVEDGIVIYLEGPGFEQQVLSIAGQGGSSNPALVIPAGALATGTDFEAGAAFLAGSTFDSAIPGLPNVTAFGGYETTTTVSVEVIPTGGAAGTRYCSPATPNSTGFGAELFAVGSMSVNANSMFLQAWRLPPQQFGYFLVAASPASIANPGGSQGTLCLGLPIGRYNRPGELLFSGTSGAIQLDLDLTDTPQASGPISVQAGQTWNFTCWYRDVNPTNTSNFTDAVSVTFQ